MAAPQAIMDLVELFDRNVESYRSGKYNETQVRLQFINPFFKALGWDVYNEEKNAEAYKDVFHEDAVKVGGSTKAPDYSFRIGGTRKFFVEAKKPSVNLKDDIGPAFQLRRYSWSAKLPLGILTDFDELAVYDGRIQPSKTDKASVARVKYFTYKEYVDRWDEIASIFSKDEILKGSFDKYAESTKGKRGTAGVDNAFLQEIERWRDLLARNIALRNPDLTTRELNFSVQRTIDRIIFLRICEDRGIERYGWLQSLLEGARVYPRLCEFFRRADERYNAGLFHFGKDSDRLEPPDELTLSLEIDDKPLKEIIKSIYYPDSPYEFSVLPPEILGQVYEQFLGKVISVSPGRRVNVDYKPEVRKAGGVYYTPSYIVDYIVDNTVGKLLEGQTPSTAAELRVLDPACGSGSFLIGAYQKLLDWHRDWYVEKLVPLLEEGKTFASKEVLALLPAGYTAPNKRRGKKKEANRDQPPDFPIFEARGGEWKLTTRERRRILLNNIYGVDIDSQAVEVTKLSLHLKVLEGENEETLSKQLKLFQERALPYLGRNIKCGNSLIGPDFYDGQTALLDDEEIYRVNAFDWEREFPEIMNRGGFDAVIGNPPYGAYFDDNEANFFIKKYIVFRSINDVYACFMEKSISFLLRKNGRHSFIVPSAWLGGPQYNVLRELVLNYQIDKMILLPFDVFSDAYVDTAVYVIINANGETNNIMTYVYKKRERLKAINLSEEHYNKVPQHYWTQTEDKKFILDLNTVKLLDKIRDSNKVIFNDIINIKRGVLFDKKLLTEDKNSPDSYRYFEGDVYRYQLNLKADRWIEFNDKMKERPKEFVWFEGQRILLRRLVNRQQRLMATLASSTFITNKNLYSVLPNKDGPGIIPILGVLNSRMISYLYINQVTQATKDDFPQVTIKDIKSLPFPEKVLSEPNKNLMESLVERMLYLHKKMAETKIAHEKTLLQRQIEATDKQIDRLVYELYGLTEEEIRIIEDSNPR